MTAESTVSPRYASASALSFCRVIAEISGGEYCLPPASTRASPPVPETTLYGTIDSSSRTSASLRPMKRLIEKIVLVGLVTAWRLATVPTRRSPLWANATTDGVVRPPSAFSITVGSPPSRTAMHEFVVPRSIPIVFAITRSPSKKISVRLAQILASSTHQFHAGRAHSQQRALLAGGALRMARAAAVAEQVDVQLELLAARGDGQHVVVELHERRAVAEQLEAGPHARDVGVDGHVAQPEGEQQHAGGGLAADPGERGQPRARLGDAEAVEVAEVVAVERAQDRLDAHRLLAVQPTGLDRGLDVLERRIAYGVPAAEAVAQAQERDVAVAVVGRLREDREDQLVERAPVRRRGGDAVEQPQPVA